MAGRGGARSSAWKPGEAPKKEKGTKNKKTVLKEAIGLSGWSQLEDFIKNEGAERLVEAMQALKGRDFVIAYSTLAEFVKPKLQRSTVVGDHENPIVTSPLKDLTFEQLYQLKYGKKPGE